MGFDEINGMLQGIFWTEFESPRIEQPSYVGALLLLADQFVS
jgi:hypothetical protein